MVNHCEDYVNFHDIEHQLQKASFITFFITVFFMKSKVNWEVSSIYSKLITGS